MMKDVLALIAHRLVKDAFVEDALRMGRVSQAWRAATSGAASGFVWREALVLLDGSTRGFTQPERDCLLDKVSQEYPLAGPCLACKALKDEPCLDPRLLCVTFVRAEGVLLRAAWARMTFAEEGWWSAEQVWLWQQRTGIALPRVFRRFYRRAFGGGRYVEASCGADVAFLSLERFAARAETPLRTLAELVPKDATGTLAERLRVSEKHGLMTPSTFLLAKSDPCLTDSFVLFAECKSCNAYDVDVHFYFNSRPHLGPKPHIDGYQVSAPASSAHKLIPPWQAR